MIIGIDLGTTNSVVGYITPEGPRLIPNALGDVLTPSVVGVEPDGKMLVGRAAKELQVLHPERCAALFKRYMGTDWTCELAGRKFTPEELSEPGAPLAQGRRRSPFRRPGERRRDHRARLFQRASAAGDAQRRPHRRA